MDSIKILGTGIYVPPKVVTNEDYATFIETSDEWIRTRTGIEKRHITTDEPTWYLGAMAAEKALQDAEVSANEIDMIICTTVSPSFFTPSMACIIQRHLNIPEVIALDINVACTGYCYAMDMAKRYLYSGDVNRVLIVNSESLSHITNYEDRTTCVLFGDGASASIVERANGIYGSFQKSDASGAEYLYATVPIQRNPFNKDADLHKYDPFPITVEGAMYMNGQEVYKFATRAMPKAILAACEKAGITVEDLDLIIPHQANYRIIETAAKILKIEKNKIYVNIQDYGNTSSASVGLALDAAIKNKTLVRGNTVAFVGFGAGLTYGATIITY